jgi:hypothetical protein
MNQNMAAFDWVTALDECSPAKVFEMLRLQVEEDVKTRNRLMSEHGRASHEFATSANGGKFSVFINRTNDHRSVMFKLTDKGIAFTDCNGKETQASLTLSDKGECVAKIGNKECEFWRLRMMALADLFTLS